MFVTSIFLFVLYDRFSFDRLLFIHLTSSSSSSRSSRSIRRALIIRIYENHIAKGGDRGRKLSASLCNIHPVGEKRRVERMEREKNMRAANISNESRNPFSSSPFHRSLSPSFFPPAFLRRMFVREHYAAEARAKKSTREKDRIQLCTIFLSVAISLPSSPLFSRTNVHGALP